MTRGSLSVMAVLILAGAARAEDQRFKKFISVRLELNGTTFWRGEQYPVARMRATLTVTNQSPQGTPMIVPRPETGARGVCEFEIKKADAGEEAQSVERTEGSSPAARIEAQEDDITLLRDESHKETLTPGRYYDIREAGDYVMRASFMGVWTDTVRFRVLPIKRVNITRQRLEKNINDYEQGPPTYPYMFYVVTTRGRGEQLIVRKRKERGKKVWYETTPISQIASRSDIKLVAKGMKTALVLTDLGGNHYQYQVDLGGESVVTSRKAVESAETQPTIEEKP